MAQIFISHSRMDRELVNFFLRACNPVGIKPIFEELESIMNGPATAERIRFHIGQSNALFILLSPNVNNIPHTRDWVLYETGAASTKDVWVFERYSDRGKVSVAIPHLQHYVVYDDNEQSLAYVSNIVRGYDDSHVLGTAIGAGLGALLGGEKDAGRGAVAGGAFGYALTKKQVPELVGQLVRCLSCQAVYQVHLPRELRTFRCPVCNNALMLSASVAA